MNSRPDLRSSERTSPAVTSRAWPGGLKRPLHEVMPAAPDDWRRDFCSQSDLPPGTSLVLKRFRSPPADDHEHCLFCWATFMDPDRSEASREFIEANPEVLTEGYATTDEYEFGAGLWVCPQCVEEPLGGSLSPGRERCRWRASARHLRLMPGGRKNARQYIRE